METQDTNTIDITKEPQNINDIDGKYLVAYCKAQGQEGIDWLKAIYSKPKKKDKDGKEREISFIEVRNEFARKYFLALAPKSKKPKKPTIKNILNDL